MIFIIALRTVTFTLNQHSKDENYLLKIKIRWNL